MQDDTDSPPRAPPIKYTAPLGTRWAKEKAAAGGAAAFDLPTDPKNIGPWILGECIGKGASGRVKIARHRRTRQLAAVKILPITPLVNSRASLATQQAKSEKQRLGIDREITMMKLMNHPNIMRIYDVYEGEKELFLVLEYVEGGELFDFLVNRGRLPPHEALLYFRQIIYGLNYAHTFSIIHRDLKPENILIASLEPPIIKIADWGMAAFAPPSLQLETSCGSPHYASPEIVNGEKYFGTATDIWSCGVILFALLTGRLPFDDKNVRTLLSKVKSGKYEMPSWIDPLAKDLLTKMLVVDVRKRISIPEIISHPWFTKMSNPSSQSSPAHQPVLPPSPSTLARPIPSPDMIDPELFNSLRVIWGRHAEAQTALIQRDLCSPAGHGTYAKAFYFLLDKYREDTMRSRNDDGEDSQYYSIGSEAEAQASMSMTKPIAYAGIAQDGEAASPHAPAGLAEPQPSAGAPISHASSRVEESTHSAHVRSPSGTNPNPTSRQSRHTVDREIRANPPPSAAGPYMPSRYSESYQSTNTRVPPPASRKSFHPSTTAVSAGTLALDKRRATGPPMSPVPRVAAPSQRSASTDITGYTTATHGGVRASPSPMYQPQVPATARPAAPSGSAMDVDTEREFFAATREAAASAARQQQQQQQNRRESLKAPGEVVDRVNGVIHAANRASTMKSMMAAVDAMGGVEDESGRYGAGRGRYGAANAGAGDKENYAPVGEGWTHVEASESPGVATRSGGKREVLGRDGGNVNRDSLIPVKGKKEKERKSRPPPLELSANNGGQTGHYRRTILGTPLHQVTSPIGQSPHPPLSSANATTSNRIMASPVVGEFKGWFSNLFNWKNLSGGGGSGGNGTNQPSIFYSMEDGPQTRDLAFAMVQSMGFGITRVATGHPSSSSGDPMAGIEGGGGWSETYQCRLDTFVSDPQTGAVLKPNRFRMEFYFLGVSNAPGSGGNGLWVAPPSPAPMAFGGAPHGQDHGGGGGYFAMQSPVQTPGTAMPYQQQQQHQQHYLTAATPVASAGGGFSFRPRHSLMAGGRSASGGSGSGASTPTPTGAMEFPPGCSCVITMVHEKGSTGTFRSVRQRLRDVFDARGLKLGSCFSPVMPATPFVEGPGGRVS